MLKQRIKRNRKAVGLLELISSKKIASIIGVAFSFQSLAVLCRFIPFLDLSFVDPTGENGFPLTVIAFMPYLLSSYDEPSNVCLEAAHLMAEVGL
jgi:hypothetical protein